MATYPVVCSACGQGTGKADIPQSDVVGPASFAKQFQKWDFCPTCGIDRSFEMKLQ